MEYSRIKANEMIRLAEPGERIEYFRGSLVHAAARSQNISQYAFAFWRAGWPLGKPLRFIFPPKYRITSIPLGTGRGFLTQEKVGIFDYRYFFTKAKGFKSG